MKKCDACGKILLPTKGLKLNIKKRFCNQKCHDFLRYHKEKNNPEYLKKKKKDMRRWYLKNKERQYKHIHNYQQQNKEKLRERTYSYINKKKIIQILPNICTMCNIKTTKIIHHETYELLPRSKSKKPKDVIKYLRWYCKHLKFFCSMECHQKYHRKPMPQTPPTPKNLYKHNI